MIEILLHGRGGQGAFTAARILGAAWVQKGETYHALAFPSFGPERRGAPVRAFAKLDLKPINNRSEIQKSDFIVYLDDTLFDDGALTGLKPEGKIVLNTAKKHPDPRIVALDANRIAGEVLGRPIANTAMLGALAALCPEITLAELEAAIATVMPVRLQEKNVAVVRRARGAMA
uniref:Pyruvate:ferredoxin oxidoreductase gamma subunit n=1 Tax=uncultured bacterium contig00045 TaxID=1181531 RepID=A0A806KII1_9BACT|nr:pyruvate:ferredoxin oxidoreductase gamma subunit [uncultured bacterium contig00045]